MTSEMDSLPLESKLGQTNSRDPNMALEVLGIMNICEERLTTYMTLEEEVIRSLILT